MHRMQPLLLTLRPPGPAHETSPELTQTYLYKQTHTFSHTDGAVYISDSHLNLTALKESCTDTDTESSLSARGYSGASC